MVRLVLVALSLKSQIGLSGKVTCFFARVNDETQGVRREFGGTSEGGTHAAIAVQQQSVLIALDTSTAA